MAPTSITGWSRTAGAGGIGSTRRGIGAGRVGESSARGQERPVGQPDLHAAVGMAKKKPLEQAGNRSAIDGVVTAIISTSSYACLPSHSMKSCDIHSLTCPSGRVTRRSLKNLL